MLKNKVFLITGTEGQLGKEFQRVLSAKGLTFYAPPEKEFNIADKKSLKEMLSKINPNIVINCAAYNAVDVAEKYPERAFAVNAEAVKNLARICADSKTLFIHYSSDYVFDGAKNAPYTENDYPNPLNIYGKSKLEGENAVRTIAQEYLIFRLSWVFGEGKQNFMNKLSQWAKNYKVLRISSDETSVPTYTRDIVEITLLSIDQGQYGLFHLTNSGQASRYEWANYFLKAIGFDNEIIPVAMDTFSTEARRPKFSVMSNALLSKRLKMNIPSWQDAVKRFIEAQKDKSNE